MTMLDPIISAMPTGLVTPKGRPVKFTPERIEQIRNLVERGKTRKEIAEILEVTVGSLQVTCSRLGVSLRRPRLDYRPVLHAPARKSDKAAAMTKDEESDVTFSLRITYRGRSLDTPLPLPPEMITRLAMEAEIHGMRLGELLASLIAKLADERF